MDTTQNTQSCHIHTRSKATGLCKRCGSLACQRCFLRGRTAYCKGCRNILKAEKDQRDQRWKPIEMGFKAIAFGLEYPELAIPMLAVVALVAFSPILLPLFW